MSMSEPEQTLQEIPQDGATAPLDEAARAQIAALARRQRDANGLLMRAINFVGGQVDETLRLLPKGARREIDGMARVALRQSFDLAARSRGGLGARIGSDRAHKLIGTLSGAIGGFGGLPTAIAEIPVATTVIFRAVHHVAISHGEPAEAEETRLQCLAVFGAGGRLDGDDAVDTAFIGARIGLRGATVHGLIGKVAPRFAAVLSQKLASQAVPLIGAAAGAGTNYAFIDYYVEMAHVHFSLRRLARLHGEDPVIAHFHDVLARRDIPQT